MRSSFFEVFLSPYNLLFSPLSSTSVISYSDSGDTIMRLGLPIRD